MAVSSVGSGTQTATLDTEHQLDEETAAGVYILKVNMTNMQVGDVVELKIYSKVLSSDTAVCELFGTFAYNAVKDSPIVTTTPVTTDTYIKCTLNQTDGTGRNFPWSLLKLE